MPLWASSVGAPSSATARSGSSVETSWLTACRQSSGTKRNPIGMSSSKGDMSMEKVKLGSHDEFLRKARLILVVFAVQTEVVSFLSGSNQSSFYQVEHSNMPRLRNCICLIS